MADHTFSALRSSKAALPCTGACQWEMDPWSGIRNTHPTPVNGCPRAAAPHGKGRGSRAGSLRCPQTGNLSPPIKHWAQGLGWAGQAPTQLLVSALSPHGQGREWEKLERKTSQAGAKTEQSPSSAVTGKTRSPGRIWFRFCQLTLIISTPSCHHRLHSVPKCLLSSLMHTCHYYTVYSFPEKQRKR